MSLLLLLLSSWVVSSILDMSYMFQEAEKFRGIGLELWDVNKNDTLTNGIFCNANFVNQSYIATEWNIPTNIVTSCP